MVSIPISKPCVVGWLYRCSGILRGDITIVFWNKLCTSEARKYREAETPRYLELTDLNTDGFATIVGDMQYEFVVVTRPLSRNSGSN